MKKLLVLALVLVAANAFAQSDPGLNGIGFYFDEGGVSNYLPTQAPYTMINCYLLATRITESSGLLGWEAEVAVIPAPGLAPTYTMNAGMSNLLSAPIFLVGMANPLPFAPAMKLLTVSVLNFGTPFSLAVGPCNPSSFGRYPYADVPIGPGYAAGNDLGKLIRLTPSSNVPVPGRAYFYTTAAFMQTAPVAIENDSWGSVKSLYQ